MSLFFSKIREALFKRQPPIGETSPKVVVPKVVVPEVVAPEVVVPEVVAPDIVIPEVVISEVVISEVVPPEVVPPEVPAYAPSKTKEHEAEVNPEVAALTDQDHAISNMEVAENNINQRLRQATASNPGLEWSTHLQNELSEAQQNYQLAVNEIHRLGGIIHNLQNQMHHMSLKSQHIQNVHAESEQHLNEQMHIFKKLSKRYEDLDRKYMDLARTLQVTDHDRSTINKQLELVSSTIESLVIKGRGKGSANLNRVTAIQRFRDLGLLTGFPVQEDHLESFHLCFFMESAMMTVLVNRLFTRPLECIFDRSSEFESICSWMEGRGSRATARWRQELCILIAQDGEEMARRKVIEVNGAIVELNDLASSVFCNVDTSISDKIKGLCNIAFDLSYAMFGMESRVYPIPVELATPFDDNYMTMAKRSGPGESVSLVVFPCFQDSKNRLYFKSKVWCT